MTGTLRQGAPNTPRVYRFVSEREIASVMGEIDPFQVEDRCPFNATGTATRDPAARWCAPIAPRWRGDRKILKLPDASMQGSGLTVRDS